MVRAIACRAMTNRRNSGQKTTDGGDGCDVMRIE
jgi:hypothetical protein